MERPAAVHYDRKHNFDRERFDRERWEADADEKGNRRDESGRLVP